ncbi:MAG: hypothetical protein J2O48_02290, partial [Solirubrobacterales bacterium]|nr:hypothetical protein [Solirubrobacterales bacterium]
MALAAAVGLAIVALGEDLSRAALLPTPFLIWAGVALIIGPITYRVTDPRAGTAERLALVAVAGVAFFLVKVVRSPFTFTVVDELFHLTNLNNILATHHLYSPNPGLSVSADYPGLEGTASAIAMLAGISPFAAGTILVGIIRVTALCAQFALFSAVSRSSAVGALGAVFSLANPNTLFFEGAFAYESLALPLFLVLLAAL